MSRKSSSRRPASRPAAAFAPTPAAEQRLHARPLRAHADLLVQLRRHDLGGGQPTLRLRSRGRRQRGVRRHLRHSAVALGADRAPGEPPADPARLTTAASSAAAASVADFDVTYYHVGGLFQWGNGQIHPFFVASLGIAEPRTRTFRGARAENKLLRLDRRRRQDLLHRQYRPAPRRPRLLDAARRQRRYYDDDYCYDYDCYCDYGYSNDLRPGAGFGGTDHRLVTQLGAVSDSAASTRLRPFLLAA